MPDPTQSRIADGMALFAVLSDMAKASPQEISSAWQKLPFEAQVMWITRGFQNEVVKEKLATMRFDSATSPSVRRAREAREKRRRK